MNSAGHRGSPHLAAYDSPLGSHDHKPGGTPANDPTKRANDGLLQPPHDEPPWRALYLGGSRGRSGRTMSALEIPLPELISFNDGISMHLKEMKRPRPTRHLSHRYTTAAGFFDLLNALSPAAATVFHTGKAHIDRAIGAALDWLVHHRVTDGGVTLALIRTSCGLVWYHLAPKGAAPLSPDSPLLTRLPCPQPEARLPLVLAQHHTWASHQFRTRGTDTADPRLPALPPPGAAHPIILSP
ncbi:hypothetical protein ACIBG6_18625 [Streptomyces sp. NPDC050842]|uniref:hypothetical protein n=1 Tax=Streptomyces sp. NPDC050842 TaxID=3365636 RepID=UPI0037A18CD4